MRVLSYFMIALGILILGGFVTWGGWLFLTASEIPLLLRVGVATVTLGFGMLILVLWTEKRREGDEG
ncbi:MAG: hypothetical protein IBX71_04350 [Candidatus Desulforudis sp.]|nr:hypothetical protein [Desulforudis sp.]